MKKFDCLTILKIGIILLTLVALGGLFMPYEKSIGEFREELLDSLEEDYLPDSDLTNKDAVNLTVLENYKIYSFAKENSLGDNWLEGEATINIVITIILIVAILLTLLFAILNKNVLVIIFDVILASSSLVMNYDITSRGVLPSDNYTYGISYYLFIVVAILILLATIAKMILKKHPEYINKKDAIVDNDKKEVKEPKKVTENKVEILELLKKYWYILVIVVVVLIAVLAFAFMGKSKDNSKNPNNNTNEVDKNNNNDNSITFPDKTQTNDNVEYTLVKTLDDDTIIIGKNKNAGTNDIEIEIEFYDKDNKFIGSDSEYIDAMLKNAEFATKIYGVPENYDHYKIFFDTDETDDISFTDKLKATTNNTGEKIVGQIENTTDKDIDYMEIAILFYKDNKVVGYDDTSESDIKPGRSANFEFDFPNDSNYDDVDFDNYKIIINEAYNYNW